MKNYKEIKGFIQNEYIRIVDILLIWNDMGIAYMNELYEIARISRGKINRAVCHRERVASIKIWLEPKGTKQYGVRAIATTEKIKLCIHDYHRVIHKKIQIAIIYKATRVDTKGSSYLI